MLAVDIVNIRNEKVSEAQLPESIWDVPANLGVLHQVVCASLATKRQGTASTKSRNEVEASGIKPYRQKGTGRARAGSRKSPLRRGGGVVFGPKPRSYAQSVPKKMYRLALRMALSDKRRSEKLLVLDAFPMEEIKTKHFIRTMRDLNVENALILVPQDDENLQKSSRNVPNFKVLNTRGLNVYDILRYHNLIVLSSSLDMIAERLGPNERPA